jgi:hypothetical protein
MAAGEADNCDNKRWASDSFMFTMWMAMHGIQGVPWRRRFYWALRRGLGIE